MDMDQSLRILGLEKGIDLETGRRAWRVLVRQWHPDRFSQAPAMRTLAEERLKEINEAWAVVRPTLTEAGSTTFRPAIFKALRRIRLRRILREIFAPPPEPGPGKSPSRAGLSPPRASGKKARGKTFDEIFNEMSDQHRNRNTSGDTSGDGRASRMPPSWRVDRRPAKTGSVRGVESTDWIDPVPRAGRVRKIGRKH